MHVIRVPNVNHALYHGKLLLKHEGRESSSRAGDVVYHPEPVTTIYENPTERVLFCPHRRANPFFHLFEALWILAGRADVEFLTYFNKRMAEFSDNGETFHAPYGFRLRYAFDFDQINAAIGLLRTQPNTRRAVLQIWDADSDLGRASKDIPCNDIIFLDRLGGVLNMTVCNRSNDIFWGAYGANVVQFSMLQEYIATALSIPVGQYRQISNNYHAYLDNPAWDNESVGISSISWDLYSNVHGCEQIGAPGPLRPKSFGDITDFNHDLQELFLYWKEWKGAVDIEQDFFISGFFRQIVSPMFNAWCAHKNGHDPYDFLNEMPDTNDWRWAGWIWMANRKGRSQPS